MAKKVGFTYSVLNKTFAEAGFKVRVGGRRLETFDLCIVAFKQKKPEEEIRKIALPFIPNAKLTS